MAPLRDIVPFNEIIFNGHIKVTKYFSAPALCSPMTAMQGTLNAKSSATVIAGRL